MQNGFVSPDFLAPLDVEAAVKAVPAEVVAKGMFFQGIIEECARVGRPLPGKRDYIAFKGYPLTDLMRLEVEAARLLYPQDPLRQGLRRLGQIAYPTLVQTMAGKIIFGVLGRDVEAVMKVAAKGYEVALNVGGARTVEVSPRHAVLQLHQMYNFMDSYQVGVVEGAILACGRTGTVQVKPMGPYEIQLRAQWT